ncbi:MAG: malate dehydrogenase [Polyangiaceae bacterium]|nr:malate dehydrogenase [Polyangiaceae bacterium]
MARRKIGLIGAGNIGGELANLCVARRLGDVVLYDVPAKMEIAKGKALDLGQAATVSDVESRIIGTADFADLGGADVLIITAGVPRKPGQSRDDLIGTNLPIIRDVASRAKVYCPDAFVIVLSNPLDAMVYEYRRVLDAPRRRVVGMAGVLDSARFAYFLASEIGVSVHDIRAMVLGGHGDDMVPLLSNCTVNGVPIQDFVAPERLASIVQRTRQGGGEIVGLMGTSAFYAPAQSALAMAEAYLLDQKRLLPAAAYLEGEYGLRDLYLGVPVVIGKDGVERIVELALDSNEREMLTKSAATVQSIIEVVKRS